MKTLLFAAAMMLAGTGVALAEDLEFYVYNETSVDLVGMNVSRTSTDEWEENLLEGYYLPAGGETPVVIADGLTVCEYDMLFTFDDGSEAEEYDVDLCELGSYTLSD